MAEQLSFLPGHVIEGQQGKYKIKKLIGSGATSYVFGVEQEDEPERSLVIKVIKHVEDQKDQEAFRREATLLRAWQTLATEQPKRFTIFQAPTATADSFGIAVPLPVPYLVEANLEHEPFYLITEHAIGEPLVARLEREQKPLPEPLLLRIGLQFTHLLHLLHTQLKRWFRDLKLENIWWDEASQRIMVTDWNVVSQKEQVEVRRDLDRWSRFLFRLLTGVSLEAGGVQTAMGVSASGLQRRGGEPWEKLTVGTREVLLRALHLNPTLRYQSAERLYEDLRLLTDAWRVPIQDLNMQIKEWLYFQRNPQRAEWLLHIMRQRDSSLKGMERLAEEIDHERYGKNKQLLAEVQSALIGGNIKLAWQKNSQYLEASQSAAQKLQAIRWKQIVSLIELGLLEADKEIIQECASRIQAGEIWSLVLFVRPLVVHQQVELSRSTGEPYRTATPLRLLRYDAQAHKKMAEAEETTQPEEQLKLLRALQKTVPIIRRYDRTYAEIIEQGFAYEEQIENLQQSVKGLHSLREKAHNLLSLLKEKEAVSQELLQTLQDGFQLAPGDQELQRIACEATVEYLNSVNYLPYVPQILSITKNELNPDLIVLQQMGQAIYRAKQALSTDSNLARWTAFRQLDEQLTAFGRYEIMIGEQSQKLGLLLNGVISRDGERFVKYVADQLQAEGPTHPEELKFLKEEAEKILLYLPKEKRDEMAREINPWTKNLRTQERLLNQLEREPDIESTVRKKRMSYQRMIQLVTDNNKPKRWVQHLKIWQNKEKECAKTLAQLDELKNKLTEAQRNGQIPLLVEAYDAWQELGLSGFEKKGDANERFQQAFSGVIDRKIEQADGLKAFQELDDELNALPDSVRQFVPHDSSQRISGRIQALDYVRKADTWKLLAETSLEEDTLESHYVAELAVAEAAQCLSQAKSLDPKLADDLEREVQQLQLEIKNKYRINYSNALMQIIEQGKELQEEARLVGAEPSQMGGAQSGSNNRTIFDMLVETIWQATLSTLEMPTEKKLTPPAMRQELNPKREGSTILITVTPAELMVLYQIDNMSEKFAEFVPRLKQSIEKALKEKTTHFRLLTLTTEKNPLDLQELEPNRQAIKQAAIHYGQKTWSPRSREPYCHMTITFISL